MKRVFDKQRCLKARKFRIRKKIRGTADRPRVSVYLSNRNIFAQVIDDNSGKTLVSMSTLGGESSVKGKNRAAARELGGALAEKAKTAGIINIVFDRNGRRFHGRVKEFANAIREKGILM